MTYKVGYRHNGCADGSLPPLPPGLSYGLQCTVDVDCPDCIQLAVVNSFGMAFDKFVASDGNYILGLEHGSCVMVAPGPITDFNATDTEYLQVTCSWSDSGAVPQETYDIYKDDVILDYDITSPYVDIFTGIAGYKVVATNSMGSSTSNMDSGHGLDTLTLPNKILDFNATDNQLNIVTCTWSDSVGNPTPTYNLFRGGIEVGTDITSPYDDSFIGIDDYYIQATNSEGTTNSDIDSGAGYNTVVTNYFIVSVLGQSTGDFLVTSDSDKFVVVA